MKNSFHNLFFLSLIALLLPSCGFFGVTNYTNLLLSNDVGETTTIDSSSELEETLFNDGPIDLPLTVAELDSPDMTKISITNTSGNVQIQGAADAVSDPDLTPKIHAYNLDTAETAVDDVGADGEFDLTLFGEPGDEILLAAVSAQEDAASPFLRVLVNELTGVIALVTTNSTSLNEIPITVDTDGRVLLSTENDDGTQTLLARGLDGSEPSVLLDDASEDILSAATQTGDQVAYLDAAGEIILLTPVGTGEVSVERTLEDLPEDADILSQVEIAVSFDDRGVIVSKPAIDGENALVEYFKNSSSGSYQLIKSDVYDDAVTATGDIYLYAFLLRTDETDYSLYRMDLDTANIANVYSERELLRANISDIRITDANASDGGHLVYTVSDGITKSIFFWNTEAGAVPVNDIATDYNTYVHPKISSGGEFVIMCRLGESAGDPNQIVLFRPSVDDSGEVLELTGGLSYSYCDENGSYSIDSENLIHFYLTLPDGTLPQHAVINANLEPAFADVL